MNDERPRGLYKAPFKTERVYEPAPEGETLAPGQVYKVSQSLLARIDVCPYSGALYLKHRGENVQTHRMAGGEAMHFVFERLTQMKMDDPEGDMPPDVAKDFAQAMMDERVDLALSADEQEGVRTAAWNFAIARNGLRAIDPGAVLGVELMLEMEIGDWTHRGKLDLVEVLEREGIVTDYKSSMWLPTVEEYERGFQNQDYALLLAYGTVEGQNGSALGGELTGIHTKQVFPRHDPKRNDDYLVTRSAYLEHQQLFDFRRVLEGHLRKLEHGLETQEWAAATGPHCGTCPAAEECPIPKARRPKVIATEGQAAELAESLTPRAKTLAADREAAKAWANEHGRIPVGDGSEAWDFVYGKKETGNKDRIKAFLAEHGASASDFYKVSESTTFKRIEIEEDDDE